MRKIMSYLKSNLCLPLPRVVKSHVSHFESDGVTGKGREKKEVVSLLDRLRSPPPERERTEEPLHPTERELLRELNPNSLSLDEDLPAYLFFDDTDQASLINELPTYLSKAADLDDIYLRSIIGRCRKSLFTT